MNQSGGSAPSVLSRLAAFILLLAILPLLAAQFPKGLHPGVVELGRAGILHPTTYAVMWLLVLFVMLFVTRTLQNILLNQLKPTLAGTRPKVVSYKIPFFVVDLLTEIGRLRKNKRLRGLYFIGSKPREMLLAGLLEWGTPVYISEEQRTMHCHCLGQTGSGKTASVLASLAFQDIFAGKAVIIIDGKGSTENINLVRNMCAAAGRTHDLRIFSPAFPDDSHTYNPVYVRPRTPSDPKGGDALAVAERVFSVFKPEMQEAYYKNLGESFFRSLICVLHGIVDEHGYSLPFTFVDILECLQNTEAIDFCLTRTIDKKAAGNIRSQMDNLGDKVSQSFMGLQNMVQKYADISVLNAAYPDIVIDDVLEKKQIVYFHLPANFYGNLTEDAGNIILQEIQQAGARRQLFRDTVDQSPAGIFIDEFSNFVNETSSKRLISSLNKSRDANLQFFLSHQTIADLEAVSKEFAQGVWDNTRTKIILFQNHPQFCEQISMSIGTHQTTKVTTRQSVNGLALRVNSGEQSTREVEEFRLHPNAFKSLRQRGQAYLIESGEYAPLNLGCMPKAFFQRTCTEPALTPSNGPKLGLNLRERLKEVLAKTPKEKS